MKGSKRTHPYWIPLALAATLMGKITVSAQDWRTVDDFALGSGDAEAYGVAVDAAGRVYVVGTANGHGIVRYSADGGTTWSTRDDSITNNFFGAVTVDPQGNLFVGGGASGGHWIVRRSPDQGVTWETVDDYYRPMIAPEQWGTNGIVYSLSSDGRGRVYGAGLMHQTGPSYNYWWVRGSGIGGTNWDSKLFLSSVYGQVAQITCAGEDVYVTGSVSGGEGFSGLIMKSSDYGATWTTNFVATQESYLAITSDSAGNAYAAGSRSGSNSVNWLVRKATHGGTNWTILDQYSFSGYPDAIAVDTAGNLCVAGLYWLTRQYSVATGQWNTTDNFSYSTDTQENAMGTAYAPDGSAFVVGYGTSDAGQRRWVVRKQSAPVSQPQLQIAVGNGSVTVSWPSAYTNSVLEWTDSPGIHQPWQVCTETVSKVAGQNTVTCEPGSGARFFRLKSAAGQ
jgi:hypothetical protein